MATKPAPNKPTPSKMLQANLQTTVLLENAMAQEQHIDWYGWYLSCRHYVANNGSFNCPLGTMIRITKLGLMSTNSPSLNCQQSVLGKRFPLPEATKLQAVFLPTRPVTAPPAAPEQLQRYIPYQ